MIDQLKNPNLDQYHDLECEAEDAWSRGDQWEARRLWARAEMVHDLGKNELERELLQAMLCDNEEARR